MLPVKLSERGNRISNSYKVTASYGCLPLKYRNDLRVAGLAITRLKTLRERIKAPSGCCKLTGAEVCLSDTREYDYLAGILGA